MPTLANMGLVTPTEDASSGVWDTLLNAAFVLIDAHDHTTGNGVQVPTDGIGIDADLPFAGFAATGLKAIDFNAVAEITSGYLTSLFVDTADNELYWRSAAGVNVQVTSGTGLNASLLGGFTGDYGSGDEEANFSAGSSIYNFLVDDSPELRAFIDCSDIRLFESTGGITNAVKLKSPASLAASYTLTLPAALPASTKLAQVTSGGVVQFTGAATMDGALTVSGAATLQSTLGVTGASTVAAVTASGLVTASAGITNAAALVESGIISPASLSADPNDWAPTGIATARIVRVACSTGLAVCNLDGINASQVAGRRLTIINLGSDTLVLEHEEASATAANRFLLVGAADLALPLNGAAELLYDGTSSRWRVVAAVLATYP